MRKRSNNNLDRKLFIAVALLSFLVLINSCFVSAFSASNMGNLSSDIAANYGYGESLKGWINISLNNEDGNSAVSLFQGSSVLGNTTIKNMLDNNLMNPGEDYTCVPSDCSNSYTSSESGGGSQTKAFMLNSGASKIVGLKITDNSDIINIDNFILNISSNSGEHCKSQLVIDFFDGLYNWKFDTIGEGYCSAVKNYGCYSQTLGTSLTPVIQEGHSYCEQISVESGAGLNVGANIDGSGSADFKFFISGSESSFCEISASGSGTISCKINIVTSEPTNYSVCLEKVSGIGNYKIYKETIAPVCGRIDSTAIDLAIFGQPIRYAPVGNNVIASDPEKSLDMDDLLKSYVQTRYSGNCSDGCYIPIKIYSYMDNQQITINSLSFDYNLASTLNDILFLQETNAKITMPFNQLNLDGSELKLPDSAGKYNLSLKIGDVEIFRKQIEILRLPVIEYLYPLEVPAGLEVIFKVLLSSSSGNITSYKWNFGDNTSTTIQETTVNQARHKYEAIGSNNLEVSVSNNFGENKKVFTIKVISPKEYINKTFEQYSNNIDNLKNQTNQLSSGLKNYIEGKLELNSKEEQLVKLKLDYESAGDDDAKYVDIMNSLGNMNIPDRIKIAEESSSTFVMNKDLVKSSEINAFAAQGGYSTTESKNQEATLAWFGDSLDVNVEMKIYSLVYGNESFPFVSYLNIKPQGKKDVESLYFVVKESDAVISGPGINDGSVKTSGSSKGVALGGLNSGEEKNLELFFSHRVKINELPIYFFPSSSELNIVEEVEGCNNNGQCESERQENKENCPNDCKSYLKMWLLIAGVVIVLFIIYIALQEWYKGRYQESLFKDSNELFNLISFISNAEKQGLSKDNIFVKLKSQGWSSEKIAFAYKKFKGERTGMYEIPIFKSFENKKVEEELARRSQVVQNKPGQQNIPSRSFNKANIQQTKPNQPNKQNINKP